MYVLEITRECILWLCCIEICSPFFFCLLWKVSISNLISSDLRIMLSDEYLGALLMIIQYMYWFMPDAIKPLPEPMLARIYVTIYGVTWPQWVKRSWSDSYTYSFSSGPVFPGNGEMTWMGDTKVDEKIRLVATSQTSAKHVIRCHM